MQGATGCHRTGVSEYAAGICGLAIRRVGAPKDPSRASLVQNLREVAKASGQRVCRERLQDGMMERERDGLFLQTSISQLGGRKLVKESTQMRELPNSTNILNDEY